MSLTAIISAARLRFRVVELVCPQTMSSCIWLYLSLFEVNLSLASMRCPALDGEDPPGSLLVACAQ